MSTENPEISTWADFSSNDGYPGSYLFQLVCLNLPAGSQVSFKALEPNPGGAPIALPWTTVPPPPGGGPGTPVPNFAAGIVTTVLPGYSSRIDIWCDGNGYPLGPGVSIALEVSIIIDNRVELVGGGGQIHPENLKRSLN